MAIARILQGQSDTAVKIWWNGCMNRQRRLVLRHGTPSQYEIFLDGLMERLIQLLLMVMLRWWAVGNSPGHL
jgi:hypothetical protein